MRAARLKRRWTQQRDAARLADRSQVSRKTVSRIEIRGTPDAETIMLVCAALRIRIVDVVPAWGRPDDDDVPSLEELLFGYRVRKRRRELGITLTTAAVVAGVSVATLFGSSGSEARAPNC